MNQVLWSKIYPFYPNHSESFGINLLVPAATSFGLPSIPVSIDGTTYPLRMAQICNSANSNLCSHQHRAKNHLRERQNVPQNWTNGHQHQFDAAEGCWLEDFLAHVPEFGFHIGEALRVDAKRTPNHILCRKSGSQCLCFHILVRRNRLHIIREFCATVVQQREQCSHFEQRQQWSQYGSCLAPTVVSCHKWIVRHQRVEFLTEVLFVHMKTEVILYQDIFHQIRIAQIDCRIQNFVVSRVRSIRIISEIYIRILNEIGNQRIGGRHLPVPFLAQQANVRGHIQCWTDITHQECGIRARHPHTLPVRVAPFDIHIRQGNDCQRQQN